MTDPITGLLRKIGVIRRGDPVLERPARRFVLPAEQQEATTVLAALTTALDRICAARPFPKGSGIAAPQLGLPVAAALARPPGMPDIALLNPKLLHSSEELDIQWEGCLSCFELRGQTVRSRAMTVRWETPDGQTVEQRFTDGTARIVAHECDHLDGILYLDRLADGATPVDIGVYPDAERPWRY